jgi:hypothetical protein
MLTAMQSLATAPLPLHFLDYRKQSRDDMIEAVLLVGQSTLATPQFLARLFNLPERSIAAIRAHATRGSYSDRARELAQRQLSVDAP